ncbi:MAG: dockerin type I domain-containing protein, partial [Myxococcota bacterium]
MLRSGLLLMVLTLPSACGGNTSSSSGGFDAAGDAALTDTGPQSDIATPDTTSPDGTASPSDTALDDTAPPDTASPDTTGHDTHNEDTHPTDTGEALPELEPFGLTLEVDRTIAVVGQAVKVSAVAIGLPPSPIVWGWEAPGGTFEGPTDTDEVTVRFDTAGPWEIEVVASGPSGEVQRGVLVRVYANDRPVPWSFGDIDGDGDADAEDQDLLRRHLNAGEALDDGQEERADLDRNGFVEPDDALLFDQLLDQGSELSWIRPTSGSRGTAVQIAHPALLDPSASVRARFGDHTVPLTRGAPGYGLVVVPLALDSAQQVELVLETVEGEPLGRFDVAIQEPPTVEGDELLRAMAMLKEGLAALPPVLEAYVALAAEVPEEGEGLSEEQGALVVAMAHAAEALLVEEQGQWNALWAELDEAQRTAFAETAVANGLLEAMDRLET